ncbi:MAG: tRNA (adenosine(37)-N6)-threonylcarbamoyltransferase complex transferase subunit TsaD [Saprospiraceae bacterium]|nr:tRNA (adenosine(37)-N6)-threonylcarbamoyltransferase complex transferase subunit TsaD [Saprospiraceae bacterium]
MNEKVKILAIESSCDDTSAAIIEDGKVMSNVVSSQILHKQYGGVVPEVASRAHLVNIIPVVDEALRNANTDIEEIGVISFTRGPGLMGSLLVGVSFAKALALSLKIPMIEVNHMQGHISAIYSEENKPTFPFLCLTVSGGHTQIVLVSDFIDSKVIGETIDDAAGEAFDKIGKLLGLDYPAGPIIDKLAKDGNPRFAFPTPVVKNFDFSFSGLKTSVLYFLKKEIELNQDFVKENLNDICASVQNKIIAILIEKFQKAIKLYNVKSIAIAGGVSANSRLREEIKLLGAKMGCEVFIPKFEYCTDNAAMIGIASYHKYLNQDFVDQNIEPMSRYPLSK